VPGAPYSYTIGAGDELTTSVPNPGTYDLSLHGPNGFFRHYAGSPATIVGVEVQTDPRAGLLVLRISGGGHRDHAPLVVTVADAYGPDRRVRVHGTRDITINTRHSGGWYDIALSTPSDPDFSHQLAGRLESDARLTSDPQLGRR
jgi:phospholipase C